MAKWCCLLAFVVVFLTEFTSPYSLNTQWGWHTSKKKNRDMGVLMHLSNMPVVVTQPHMFEAV